MGRGSNWRTSVGGNSKDVEDGLKIVFWFFAIIFVIAFFILRWIFRGIKSLFNKAGA